MKEASTDNNILKEKASDNSVNTTEAHFFYYKVCEEQIGDADENGMRTVFFRLNGQTRAIEVKDKKSGSKKASNAKVSSENHIGAPLQGLLSKIFVKEGDTVKRNTPLFTIEAMKMETTITANKDLKIKDITLKEGTLVESDDLVMEVE